MIRWTGDRMSRRPALLDMLLIEAPRRRPAPGDRPGGTAGDRYSAKSILEISDEQRNKNWAKLQRIHLNFAVWEFPISWIVSRRVKKGTIQCLGV